MLLRTLRRFSAAGPASLAGLAAALAAPAAQAQYFGGYDPCCNPCCAAPVCQQTAMVVQPCYQTVPVTEYQEVKQTVMRPQVETRYVEQPVTEYRPVTETKTAEVPVTTYQPVTEYQSVCQDRGCWQTQYVPNCRLSPCQYDNRPGLLGWMNRTGYEMRSAFTPKYTAHRYYTPNVVTTQVPVTRHVAQHGTRQVTYNVTRMEAHQTTRQVAVNETKWVAEEQTVSRPVTTYRSVPVGTTIAYAPIGAGGAVAFGGGAVSNVAYGPIQYGGSATALAPTPDTNFQTVRSKDSPTRTATGPKPAANGQPYERATPPAGDFGKPPGSTSIPRVPQFRRLSDADRSKLLEARRLAKAEPARDAAQVATTHEAFKAPSADAHAERKAVESLLAAVFRRPVETSIAETNDAVAYRPTTRLPGMVRSVRWTAPTEPAGPELHAPSLAAIE